MAGPTIRQLKTDKRRKSQRQADFLAYFSECASVSRAAKKARVHRSVVYDWLNKKGEAKFQQLYEIACKEALGSLEDEAVRRAYEGVSKPVFQSGKKVGSIREYSDTLLIVLLKARAPEKYKERVHKELTGKDGGPVQVVNKITHNLVVKKCDK